MITVSSRNLFAKSTISGGSDSPHGNHSKSDRKTILTDATGLAMILLAIVSVGLATETLAVLLPTSMLLIVGPGFLLRQLLRSNRTLSFQLDEAKNLLVSEASASRVLSGIKALRTRDGLSPYAKITKAARLATGYQASVLFDLRDSQGVLLPSIWNYQGNLEHIRDAFESVDSDLPGAVSARQGSAIVISSSPDGGIPLPSWAEHAGFTHGIVAPISSGLNTIAVVYVLQSYGGTPTIQELEQLELLLNFASSYSLELIPEIAIAGRKSFRIDAAPIRQDQINESVGPIQMPGFALNPKSERMEMDGVSLSLSPTEFSLIHTLASSPNKPLSPAVLMDQCWGNGSRPADNSLDVAIFRLRKKLNKLQSGKGVIKTVRGSGYMFIPPRTEVEDHVTAD